jgi:putative SOS response-associated peptidase YedK
MCYSNSSTSSNIQLAQRYKRNIPDSLPETPIFFASGFQFPTWRVITSNESIEVMNWGLIPHWYKRNDTSAIAANTLNAKIETLTEKASFRQLVDRNRCIVPSTGFFEWQTMQKRKIPFFIFPTSDSVFSMAGLMDQWMMNDGSVKKSFTIITCQANELMSEIHNTKKRMPVVLRKEQEENWLTGKLTLDALEVPFPSEWMNVREVNKSLIGGKNPNDPAVQQPFDNGFFAQASLF